MNWDVRQRAMLAAMGLRVWSGPPAAPDVTHIAVSSAATAVAVLEMPPARVALPDKVASPIPLLPPSPVPVLAALAPTLRQPLARPAPMTAVPAVLATLSQSLRAQAIARMDWQELQHSAADCRACPLCEGRNNSVFGVGAQRADWMVVGELPGEQEDLAGMPFAGQPGQLLNNMLRALGLEQGPTAANPDLDPARRVYIANALKCRPPLNRSAVLDDVQQCAPYLQRQIEWVQPRVILALGRWAIQSLLNSSEPLGRLRGRVHDYRGIAVIVSYPPSYLLRNLADKALAWDDLCLALQTLQSRGRP